MNSNEHDVWLAAAQLESAEHAADQAKDGLSIVIGSAIGRGESVAAVASAANMTSIEILALSGSSAATEKTAS